MFAVSSGWRQAILVLVLTLIGASPLHAQTVHPVSRVDEASTAIVETETATASGRASITLRNADTKTVNVIVSDEFRHDASATTTVASWTRFPRAEAPSGSTFTLRADETATFEVVGHFDRPGLYETSLSVDDVDGAGAQRFVIRIARTLAPLPDDFLADPPRVRIELGAFEALSDGAPVDIRVNGRNALTEPVTVGSLVTGAIIRTEGDARMQAATNGLAELRQTGCDGEIAAGWSCALDLRLPARLAPGSYMVDVMVTGAGGGQSQRTIAIDVRASAWLAGIVIAIGVVLGALVAGWREVSRQVSTRRIAASLVRDRAAELANSSKQAPVARRARELVARLHTLDAEIVDGADPTATLDELKPRLEQLRRAEHLLGGAAKPSGEAAGMFRGLALRLVAALEAVEWPGEVVDATSKALGEELGAFPQLLDAVTKYDAVAARLAAAVSRTGPDAAIQAEWEAARSLREKAFERLTAAGDPGKVATRATDLDAAADKLAGMTGAIAAAVLAETKRLIDEQLASTPADDLKQQLEALSKENAELVGKPESDARLDQACALRDRLDDLLPKPESTEAVVAIPTILPPDSGAGFEPLVIFQPGIGATGDQLRRSARHWNVATNAVALGITAALGVLVLWVPNPAWGSVQDVLLAFVSGAGTRLAIGPIAPPTQE